MLRLFLVVMAALVGGPLAFGQAQEFDVEIVDLAGFDSRFQGYYGTASLNGYVYFAPYRNGPTQSHGLALRLKSNADFSSHSSWEMFDLTTLRADLKGFSDIVVVGHELYYVPYYVYTDTGHREPIAFVRYDATGEFMDPSSWKILEVPEGFGGLRGAAFLDGTIYAGRPMNAQATIIEIGLRDFAVTSHDSVDLVGAPQHFIGAVSTGVCVYFTPATLDWTAKYGYALRRCGGRWESYDLSAILSVRPAFGGNPVFDGRYVYLAPYQTGVYTYDGVIVRHDTTQPIDKGWETFDQRRVGASNGFAGAFILDGNVGFVPYRDHLDKVAMVAPLFSLSCGRFSDPACWTAVDTKVGGLISGTSIGAYAYLSPLGHGHDGTHGVVVRIGSRSAVGGTARDARHKSP